VTLPADVRTLLRAASGATRWPGADEPADGAEMHLKVTTTTRSATAWARRGHVVGWDQAAVGRYTSRSAATTTAVRQSAPDGGHDVVLDRGRTGGDGLVHVTSGDVVVSVDPASATVSAIACGDQVIVSSGPRLELFRAAVDNDGLKLAVGSDDPWWIGEQFKPLARWLAAGLAAPDRQAVSVLGLRPRPDGSTGVRLIRDVVVGDATVRHTETVTVDRFGVVTFDEAVRVPAALDDLARVGVSLRCPAALAQWSWLGLGPEENYPDRRASSVVGRFALDVDDTYVDYVMPQHHGTRGDIRWMALWAPGAAGRWRPGMVLAPAPPPQGQPPAAPLWCTARRLTDDDLWSAVDVTDLPGADELADRDITVHVDAAVRGLGTGSCGPDTAPQYRVGAGWHRWVWTLRPWRPADGDPSSAVRC
jgi:beta-galactosidase